MTSERWKMAKNWHKDENYQKETKHWPKQMKNYLKDKKITTKRWNMTKNKQTKKQNETKWLNRGIAATEKWKMTIGKKKKI